MANEDPPDMIQELYAYDGAMFGHGVDVYKMLTILENNLLMLSDPDQQFVQEVQLMLGTGSTLNAQQVVRLKQIVGTLSKSSHNTLGDSISPLKMVKDLVGAKHTLNQGEKQTLVGIINKLNKRVPLSVEDITQLVEMYSSKGF